MRPGGRAGTAAGRPSTPCSTARANPGRQCRGKRRRDGRLPAQRLDLSTAEPTPPEALAHLHRAHVHGTLAARVALFLRACDAGRLLRNAWSNRGRWRPMPKPLSLPWRPSHACRGIPDRCTTGRGHGTRRGSAPPDAAVLDWAETEFRAGVAARDRPDQARKHFRAALEHYETLRRQGILNPGLCRNQGNAALLADDLPTALMAYRRRLASRSLRPRLAGKPGICRDQVAYPAGLMCRPAAGGWPPWLPRPTDRLLLGTGVGPVRGRLPRATRWLVVRRGSRGVLVLVLAGAWACGGGQGNPRRHGTAASAGCRRGRHRTAPYR